MAVQIQSTSGVSLGNVTIYSNLNKTTQYAQSPSFSLLAWKGQTVRLAFVGNTNSTLATVFRVDDVSLSVTIPPPTAATLAATSVTSNSAQLNGTVNPNGASTSTYFQYGTTASYGGTTASVAVGSGTSSIQVSATLSPLNQGTGFHYRLVAVNSSLDVTDGNDVTFSTILSPTITLSSPNAGATWQVGTSQTVGWSISGDTSQISYLSVLLSTNNGSNYTAISSNLSPSTQSFNYTPAGSNATTSAVIWVRAFNSGGTALAGATSSGAFTIANPAPTISGITPNSGSIVGGDSVTISGGYLKFATSVTFGGTAATIAYDPNNGDLQPITPAHAAGVVNVSVTTPGGTVILTNGYTYVTGPTITLSTPNAGATWQVGASQTISWSIIGDASQINYVSVLLSTNNGGSYAPFRRT